MTCNVRAAGAWRAAGDVWVHAGGAWRRVTAAYVRQGGTWRQIHAISATPSLAVTVSPGSRSLGYDSNSAAGSYSQAYTPTMSGGIAPYSGAWSQVAAGASSALTTSTSGSVLTLAASWARHAVTDYGETWRYSVTDAAGNAASVDVALYIDVHNGST